MDHRPSEHVPGKLNMTPTGVAKEPSENTPMETQSSWGVPPTQLFMWSQAALAADIAELSFLAAITAAPRFCTAGMNSLWIQASLLMSPTMDLPPIVAWAASGNCVELWLPQMVTFLTSCTLPPTLAASWDAARFWSSRVIAEKFSFGMDGA